MLRIKECPWRLLMVKKYKMGFDIQELVLFIAIMIPNIIWFAVPAPNDILRTESITKIPDTIASISQVVMLVALCVFINAEREKRNVTRFIMAVIINCVYFICWIFYYIGISEAVVILGMTIFPCLAFLFFTIDRKNNIAIIPIFIFTICHLIYGITNYII